MHLLQADDNKVICSQGRYLDLFFALLCGLGSTGVILDIHMEVTHIACVHSPACILCDDLWGCIHTPFPAGVMRKWA